MTKKYSLSLILILFYHIIIAQTPCENAKANGYDCNQIDFYANISNSILAGISAVDGNDIWGWTDSETGIEYALVGQSNGTVFVSIQNPENPEIVGRLPSETDNASVWRDIKVYDDHAFIVADNNTGHGMQIFDLSRLREFSGEILEFNSDAVYTGVSSAHNVVINEETGYAYIVGARNAGNNCGRGGLHIVNIKDPKDPVFAGCFDVDGYTHDAQCVTYNGPDKEYQGMEVCFNANENTVTIANVDDKENTSLIAKSGYPQSAYSHQGWLTEDHQYFISNDELDEQGSDFNTRTLIWDVRDLDNPKLINQHFSEKASIDHNLYVKDNLIYQSNYTSGLVILDAEKIAKGEIRERGFFDTFPNSNNNSFNGSWSNYPFFESGVIVVNDKNNGFFVLKLNIQELIIGHPTFEGCSDDNTLKVELEEGMNPIAFQWQRMDKGQPENLENDEIYAGTDEAELVINNEELENLVDATYRCRIEFETGEIAYSYISNTSSGLPEANFTFDYNELEVSFVNNTINGTSYEWDFGDNSPISKEESPVHTYQEEGIYAITLTAFNDCGESVYSESLDFEILLSNDDEKRDLFNIYPIPFRSSLKIDSKQFAQLNRIEILDQRGRTVKQINEFGNSATVNLNTSNWETGVYFLRIFQNDGNMEMRKILKQ